MFVAQTTQPSNDLTNIIVPLIPWIIVFAFVWFFVFRLQRRQSKANIDQIAVTRRHQAAVEDKLDRLIGVIEHRSNGG